MKKYYLLVLAFLMLFTVQSQAIVVNVDFDTNNWATWPGINTCAGIGVAPDTGTFWNSKIYSDPAGVFRALKDSYGNDTTVGINLNVSYGWALGETVFGGTTPLPIEQQILMRDYIYVAGSNTGNVKLNGLTNSSFDIYLYGQNRNGGQFTKFIVGSQNKETTLDNAATVKTQLWENEDYVVLKNITPVDGMITITWTTGTGASYAPFNGFQLVQVPEPLTLILLGIGTALLRKK
ncbi:MAG: hypothetical protein A2Y10_15275 [Planctomycetes bacterium GWF2_41_51]|nr:MAG: hypothetical protein A2Y10_15275 [Planctomycetes bacterium GWF2_41_51]